MTESCKYNSKLAIQVSVRIETEIQ